MSWEIRLSKEAVKELKRLPRDRRERLSEAIEEMAEDLLSGDVRAIKAGKFKGALRKRVGRYRIIFALNPEAKTVEIAAILLRSEKTYR